MATKISKGITTETRTSTFTRPGTRELTWEEEMVVRMRKGLSESDDAALEFRGQTHPETQARLAMIEAHLLSEMHGVGPWAEAEEEADVDQDVKGRILDTLSGFED